MNIVDSHIHFWDITNGYNDWVKDTNLPKLVTPE
ncbi:amidohydrolase, partial [Francisella tularensis subsp. holarctica]|nr:amidohydrolase [Francisella tularensis subsp. holarctica]